MLDYILAADLLVMTLLLAHLSWHCMKWRNELPVMAESATGTTAEIIEIMNDGGAILSDIAEILEGSPSATAPSPAGMPNIPELLLNVLMSKATMSSNHGSKEKSGEVHEENITNPPEQMEESD